VKRVQLPGEISMHVMLSRV